MLKLTFKLMNISLVMLPNPPFEIQSLGLIAFWFSFLPGWLWSAVMSYLSFHSVHLPSRMLHLSTCVPRAWLLQDVC